MTEYNDYAIRLDGTDHSKLTAFLDSDGGAYLVVRELAESNSHYHAIIHSKKKLPAFRSAFVRAVLDGQHGNGAYSITRVKDIDKYERYMTKGDSEAELPVVVGRNGVKYNDEWVRETHDRYWKVNDELNAKRRKLSMVEAVVCMAKEEKIAWSNREKLALLYIRELADRDKAINIFSVRSNLNLVQIKLCPDDTAIADLAAVVAQQ